VIANKYAEKYPDSVVYVKKENGGHGSTINKGIELASGKYFKVIDGDDWVDTKKFSEFVKNLRNADSDMVLTSYVETYPSHSNVNNPFAMLKEREKYDFEDICSKMGLITLHTLTVKTKLLKQSEIKITEHCYYVDIEFIFWSIYLSDNFIYYNLPVYMYRLGNETQSVNKNSMVKNLSMHETVSLNLVRLYSSYNLNSNEKKKKILFDRLAQNVGANIRIYFLLDQQEKIKDKIIKYDNLIQEIDCKVFKELSKDMFIRAVRFMNYSLIPFIRQVYLLWLRKR
jgi:glycosyltransferase involved in cell wall biosynthesis